MDIKPVDVNVQNLLQSGFYKIPRFQRPYSWDRENVGDFWDDSVLSEDPDYFIGSFVLYRDKSDNDVLCIVDGQQRLTTITLLLAATRHAFAILGENKLAVATQQLIEREDINSVLRFVLDSETPYPYLQEYIQKFDITDYVYEDEIEEDGDDEIEDLGVEQRAIQAAYEYFEGKIGDAIEAIDIDSTIDENKKLKLMRDKLVQIRDSVLRLQLITVELSNEDDAYLIFETLNTRGKNLTVSDLVKNHLTRLLKPTNTGLDAVKDKWNGILSRFDDSEYDISVNRFLHHSWLSRKPYVTEKKLFKEVKRTVEKVSAKKFLNTLVSDSKLYRQILDPDSYKWTKQERKIAESLRALLLFRVVQPVPMLLSLMREYRATRISMKQTRTVLERMENFHVQFTAVTSQRTGGGTAFMYGSSARLLLGAKDKIARNKALKGFGEKLKDRIPSNDEFDAGFFELWFTNDRTRLRGLVRYLLRRLDEHLRTGPKPDYDNFSIEHIGSQNPAGKVEVSEEWIGAMGNMLLIDSQLNEKLENKNTSEKLKILKAEGVPMDPILAKASKWSDTVVEARTAALAELFRKNILKL